MWRATSSIETVRAERKGRKPGLTLKQKVVLLLLQRLFDRSNREMSAKLLAFSLLTGIDVSYKTWSASTRTKRCLALQNLHALLLREKGIGEPDCSRDGTGYSLSVRKDYATEVQRKDKAKKNLGGKTHFVYTFKLMDLNSRMYVGYGTSFKSEKDAFLKAIKMARNAGVKSLRLDRYYSAQKYVELLEEEFENIATQM